ncbi:MAG TPA: dihydrofolate reductase [Drouetiella sp.]
MQDEAPRRKFDIVVACDLKRGIGLQNGLPWRLPSDMKHFRELTAATHDRSKQNAVLMGRNTWESIPTKFRPLPGRLNVVLTRNADYKIESEASVATSLEAAFAKLDSESIEKCFIIGGAHLYEEAVHHPLCDVLHLTQIDATFECDTFFPQYEDLFTLISTSKVHNDNGIEFCFKKYQRKA